MKVGVFLGRSVHLRVLTSISLVGLILYAAPAEAGKVLTFCQQGFEDDWANWLPFTWRRCKGFRNTLSRAGDTIVGHWSLEGGKQFFHPENDQNGMERASIAFVATHGGTSDPDEDEDRDRRVSLSMYDFETAAWFHRMHLGNESTGLSIFAAYACDTLVLLNENDGEADWTEMHEAFDYTFEGGLRMFLGSTDLFWASLTTDEVGRDFADQLLDGRSVINAWGDATQDWFHDHYPAGLSAAAKVSEAKRRRDTMTWQNFPSFDRVRGADVKRFASMKWED